MLHDTIFILYINTNANDECPLEPVSVCDYAVFDENRAWMDEERERKMKEYGVTEAKWVEVRLTNKVVCKIQDMFSQVVTGGTVDEVAEVKS